MLCSAFLFEDLTKRSQKVSRKEAENKKSSKVGSCSENIVKLEWFIIAIFYPSALIQKVFTVLASITHIKFEA